VVGIHLGSLTPIRKHGRKVRGSFQQLVTVTNNGPDPIQGALALVLDNLGPRKRVHHRLVPQVTLLNADGTTQSISPGSPFLFGNAPIARLQPSEAVTFLLEFHTKGSGKITFNPLVLVGFSQP
jgi:hypothetical protein